MNTPQPPDSAAKVQWIARCVIKLRQNKPELSRDEAIEAAVEIWLAAHPSLSPEGVADLAWDLMKGYGDESNTLKEINVRFEIGRYNAGTRCEVRFLRPSAVRYSERLAEAGVEPSVGSKGDSYDNALAETINGLYKAELIHRRAPWKTKESVELATLEWVAWFNHHRLLEPIEYIPPAEAEANYYRQLASQATTVEA